jgi:hypothetical protein
MSLQGSNDKEKLRASARRPTRSRPCGSSTRSRPPSLRHKIGPYLSSLGCRFWGTTKDDAEKFWKFVAKCIELDTDKKAAGSDLDEFQAHRFLEHFQESMTVQVRPPPPAR